MSGDEFLLGRGRLAGAAGSSKAALVGCLRVAAPFKGAFPAALSSPPSSSGLTRGSAITPFSVLTVWILGSSPRMTKEKVEADEGGG